MAKPLGFNDITLDGQFEFTEMHRLAMLTDQDGSPRFRRVDSTKTLSTDGAAAMTIADQPAGALDPFRAGSGQDQNLHLLVDGQMIRPAQALHIGIEQRFVFNLPLALRDHAGSFDTRLASGSTVSAGVQRGVIVESVVLFHHAGGAPLVLDMAADDLQDGWSSAEVVAGRPSRWTNGSAAIPVTSGTRSVEVILAAAPDFETAADSPGLAA
ncbi:hypothetical protein ACELLULO517_20775 [Acidisoma cellulosilytica]|uniref:Uncharacterized protein n=1 Tax=Acidisoma cellulosilyticum TaxID=2802395 RepID=A0A964E5M6_9PROT|nr:hypothetical protein [Acidisoma cellulosilyticum]MCB8882691.1 hypothetical protein [Acidisoma cellulosilyticum]